MTSPPAGNVGSAPSAPRSSSCQVSATTRRSLISTAIDLFLEGIDADAVHDVNETLGVAVAALEIAFDQALDDVGNLVAREGRADDLADRGADARPALALVAADLDLVPLLAVLVDAQHADVADVVVAAGVHASRDVEIDVADVVQVVEVVEAALERLGHRNRFCVRERAKVAARAADDVRQQPDVGRREAERAR